jgi:hypothetical protein
MLLALLVTLAGLLITILAIRPEQIDADLNALRRTVVTRVPTAYDPTPCATTPPSVLVVREI